ncbi:unnamed protein product [Acanthosepion pharaonis]|uniref:Uncharacterized protein n=1 Tax=Acanthosepion pharaonis TaxID=158019 RepID=A0A812EL53_ACAPH|nr:unnamed protein product [Sepia pharaonis]
MVAHPHALHISVSPFPLLKAFFYTSQPPLLSLPPLFFLNAAAEDLLLILSLSPFILFLSFFLSFILSFFLSFFLSSVRPSLHRFFLIFFFIFFFFFLFFFFVFLFSSFRFPYASTYLSSFSSSFSSNHQKSRDSTSVFLIDCRLFCDDRTLSFLHVLPRFFPFSFNLFSIPAMTVGSSNLSYPLFIVIS